MAVPEHLSKRIAYANDCQGVQISSADSERLLLQPSSYCNWRESPNMIKACESYRSGKCSLRQASELYGVPKSTFYDHISGKVKQDSVPGPYPYLTLIEEEELCSFLIGCSQIGYPRTRPQVLAIVQQHMNQKQINKVISNGWWQRFRARHPQIVLRSSAPLSMPRAMAADRTTLEKPGKASSTSVKASQKTKESALLREDYTGNQERTDDSEGGGNDSQSNLVSTRSAQKGKASASQATKKPGKASSTTLKASQESTDCSHKCCKHPSAIHWVACTKCGRWFHCICTHIRTLKKAKEMDFICQLCQ